jgi:hypothetical protein
LGTHFEYSLHYSLSAVHSALLDKAKLAVFVHVLRKTADKRFISLYLSIRPTKLRRRAKSSVVQSRTKPLKHEPRGLLGDSESAVDLHARHTVLAINQHPESGHPLVETERRILENRPDFQRELLIAATAEPQTAGFDEVVFLGTAPWADDFTVRPTKLGCILERPLRVGEVNDGFL